MTRKELASQIQVYEKWNRKATWPFLSALAGAMLIILTAHILMGENFKILVLVIAAGWLFGTFYIFLRAHNKMLMTLNLHCPVCDTQLIAIAGKLATATLYCSGCGNKIIEEDNDSQNAETKI